MSIIKKVLIPLLVVVPVLLIAALTVYWDAYREYGTPSEYRAEQERQYQARMDSLSMERDILTPETMGDSVLVNVGDQGSLFEENRQTLDHIARLRATLDSIRSERSTIEEKEASVAEREELLRSEQDAASDANIAALAGIYDNMDVQQAVPLIIEMDDTLAVRILANMEERNASDLLAGVAETDINKATRLNTMLAEMGIGR